MNWLMVAAAVGLSACAATGQQVRYLEPSTFQADRGDDVSLSLRDSQGVDAGWPDDGMTYFFVRVAGTQENRDQLATRQDGGPSWTMQHDGLAVIGIDLKPREVEMSGAQLGALSDAAGGVATDDVVTVTHVESFKAYVRVGDLRGAQESATEKTSLQVDLRTLMDPSAMRAGSTLAFRAYVEGRSAAGANVVATHLATGERRADVADDSGIGHVVLDQPGAWRLEFHDLRPPKDDDGWRLYSSTLTFEIKEARP